MISDMETETTEAGTIEVADKGVRVRKAVRARRGMDSTSLPEQCVIRIPGQNVEVPAIFKSWIGDRVISKKLKSKKI